CRAERRSRVRIIQHRRPPSVTERSEMRKEDAILVVAAHGDDETLGCGGAMARWANEGRSVHVLLLADGESSRSASGNLLIDGTRVHARMKASEAACAILGCVSVDSLGLPDNRMDGIDLLDVVKYIEEFIQR